MPRGTRHELTGLLLDDRPCPILRLRDGGEWRLDISGRYAQFIGRHVRVTGKRSDFNLLDVERIEAE